MYARSSASVQYVMNLPEGKSSLLFDLNGNGGMYLQSGMSHCILKNPTCESSNNVFDFIHLPLVISGIFE